MENGRCSLNRVGTSLGRVLSETHLLRCRHATPRHNATHGRLCLRPRSDTIYAWTGASCVYGCATCPIGSGVAVPAVSLSDLRDRLAIEPVAQGRLVVFVGGEPLLNADLMRYFHVVRALEFTPGLVTTGRPLVYPQIRARLRTAGVRYLRIQLFGHREEHDESVRVAGAYEQVLRGLHDWMREAPDPSCEIDVAVSLRDRSTLEPAEILRTLDEDLPAHLPLIVSIPGAEPWTAGKEDRFHGLFTGQELHSRVLVWEGIPASWGNLSLPRTVLPGSATFLGYPPGSYLGSPADFTRAHRREPHKAQANSFNFIRRDCTVAFHARAADCMAAAATAEDPGRCLWLIEEDRLVLYVTDTGDFDAAQIESVKDRFSHLFLDRAVPGVLDDFVEGMRRVLPDEECHRCDRVSVCGRRFRMVEGPPFARQEAWIAEHVSGVRGAVLDVGCGEQLYRDRLAPLLRSGVVRYTGLDPDVPSLSVARRALPEGVFHQGGIEDFYGVPESYDHILCLRSLNHVLDMDEALARMMDLLKPGGLLLIVECTPFAMLREPRQIEAADTAPRAGHQHLRNVSSEEVLPFALRRGLRLVHHDPSRLEGTNQWVLLFERPRAF